LLDLQSVGSLTIAAKPGIQETLQAQTFEVVDAQGHVRMEATTSKYGPGLFLLDENGTSPYGIEFIDP